MKEFNIYVKRPPVGEVIIYMLTYHITIGLSALVILFDSRVRELAIKRINVNNRFVLNQLLRDVHKHTFAKFGYSIITDAGGVVFANLETRDGDEILTRDGIDIEAWQMVKELEVLAHKFIAAKDDLCVDAGGVATEWLLTNNGEEILTHDGVNIKTWHMAKELEVLERMFTTATDKLCVDAGGAKYGWLLTNNGEEILTCDGDKIEAWYGMKELEVLERMFASAQDNLRVDAGGATSGLLLTNDGSEILTYDGEEIEAFAISDKLAVFFKQTIDGEDDLCVDAGGVATEWLLTNNGEEILTRDDDEIETLTFSNNLPIFFKQSIEMPEDFTLLSDKLELPVLGCAYDDIDHSMQVDGAIPNLICQDILGYSDYGISLTSGMLDMSGEQTFTLVTKDGVAVSTRNGDEIIAYKNI